MRHVVPPAALLLSAVLWLVFVAPIVPASGHEGEGPSLDLLESRVSPGQQVRVFGDDLDPDETVTLELFAHGEVHALGPAATDADGHLEAVVIVPPGIMDGYAELRATTVSGSVATTWILVGEPDLSAGLPGTSPPVDQAASWTDPSVVVLGILLGGAGAALLYLLLRPAQPKSKARAKPRT
jgi:hypothetical protein